MSIQQKEKGQHDNNKIYDDDLNEIFKIYTDQVLPYTVDIEELDDNFPVFILNEIRDTFTHVSRSYLSSNNDVFFDNISKAKGHLIRTVLDCYKYLCMIYDNKYLDFDRIYKNVDLSNIDNGDFLRTLCELRGKAVELTRKVRKLEIKAENIEDLYEDFQNAYEAHRKVYDLITSSYKKLEHFKRKSSLKNKLTIASFVFGALGTAFGGISIILNFN